MLVCHVVLFRIFLGEERLTGIIGLADHMLILLYNNTTCVYARLHYTFLHLLSLKLVLCHRESHLQQRLLFLSMLSLQTSCNTG